MKKGRVNYSYKTICIVGIVVGLLILASFYYGFSLGAKETISKFLDEEHKYVSLNLSDKEYRDSLKKCGDIPKEVSSRQYGGFVHSSKPVWSPDCRYIAYTITNGGTVVVNEDGTGVGVKGEGDEGMFIYSVESGEVKKLKIPKGYGESQGFVRWSLPDEIIFSYVGNDVRYERYSLKEDRVLSDLNRF